MRVNISWTYRALSSPSPCPLPPRGGGGGLGGEGRATGPPPAPAPPAGGGRPGERRQRQDGEHVADAGRRERRGDAEARGKRVEALGPVELHVLAGIEEVEAGDPDRDREPEEKRREGE